MPSANGFTESHRRALLANARYADKLVSDIEGILSASESKSPFPKYRPDVSLHQARLIRSQLARFRDHLGRVMSSVGIQHGGAQFGSLHSIRVTLTFVRIAVQEMTPEQLRGYGDLPEAAASDLRGLCRELEGLIDGLERNLALGAGVDLQARLERIGQTTKGAELLRLLDRITLEDELAEFRAPLLNLVERVESPRFEIAVFGRVSSGKSTLLNHLLETSVLPVGVNPITAVPTRLVYGGDPHLTVTLSDREVRRRPINELAGYASEEQNPGNERGVTKLVVALPSPRLQTGLVLVDTPGLGALATAGAAETRSYLPQCDLGILLLSAVNPINEEDLSTIEALSMARIPILGLLSKADLLPAADRMRALDYTRKAVFENLGLSIDIHPVSTIGDDEALLRDWFNHTLSPLFTRHQELAVESMQRKAGVLREAVTAALRLKLGNGNTGPPVAAPLEELERQLRTAAGEIEETRRYCLDASDEIQALYETARQRCVEAVLESWRKPEPGGLLTSGIINRAAGRLAAEATSQISGRLTGLAGHLGAALARAAEILPNTAVAAGEALQDCVREMPRFEAALPEMRLARPWFPASDAVTRMWLKSKFEGDVARGLQAGFASYGRAIEGWTRRVLGALQERFDARADVCRAQLARLLERKRLSQAQCAAIEGHLAELERTLAASETGCAVSVGLCPPER
ncbi:MAG: dynamin family protein [Bryobacterales bacterium]|nr:dynamin family protein [Bryobacterales bacterium]